MRFEDIKIGMLVQDLNSDRIGTVTGLNEHPYNKHINWFTIIWDSNLIETNWAVWDFDRLDFVTPNYKKEFEGLVNEV